MAILVTGARGQLGSELCARLGERALGVDVDTLDLTNPAAVERFVESQRPEAIVNCAAYTAVDRAEQDEARCIAINAEAVATLAGLCRRLDVPLVQISTDYVFGGDGDRQTVYAEEDPPSPLGVYGRSKLEGERNAAAWQRHLIVRSCGLYAAPRPGQPIANFAQTILRLGSERGKVRVVTDQVCSPTYVPNLAAAVLYLLERVETGTFHAVDRGAISWYAFAVELFRQAGMEVVVEPITTTEYEAERLSGGASQASLARRPAYSVLSTAKYDRVGGPPMPAWQASIAAYLVAIRSGSTQSAFG
jgi:dTDP-4-dehydrorhamnose reductase